MLKSDRPEALAQKDCVAYIKTGEKNTVSDQYYPWKIPL